MPLILLYFLFFCLFQKVPRTIYTEWSHWTSTSGDIFMCIHLHVQLFQKANGYENGPNTHARKVLSTWPAANIVTRTVWHLSGDGQPLDCDSLDSLVAAWEQWKARPYATCTCMHNAYSYTYCAYKHIFSCVLTLMCVTRTITTRRQTLRMGVFYQKIPWHIFQHRKDSENHCNWKTII